MTALPSPGVVAHHVLDCIGNKTKLIFSATDPTKYTSFLSEPMGNILAGVCKYADLSSAPTSNMVCESACVLNNNNNKNFEN